MTTPREYTLLTEADKHTCWDTPDWDGLLDYTCAGCVQADKHPCRYCGYGEAFTTHNDLAHAESGDMLVPDIEEIYAWRDSPHVYRD